MRQKVWVPLGYYFGYHWGTILGTIMTISHIVKIDFFQNLSIYWHTLGTEWYPKWYPNGTQNFLSQSMKFQLSKTVSTVIVRRLDRSLTLFEIV